MARTQPDRGHEIEAFVADDVAAVLADARRDAVDRVRRQLTDALAEAMLESALRQIGDPPPVTEVGPVPPPAGASALTGTGVYVYCVVPSGVEIPSDVPSIDVAHPPVVIRRDGLAAVVSEVSLADFDEDRLRERLADMKWLERTARAHEQVLETVSLTTTLIPMRLCSVYRDEEGVSAMLAREAQALEEALTYLEGKREWGIKVFAGAAGAARDEDAAASDGDAAASDSGTDYMRRRRVDRERRLSADQELYDACATIHQSLAEAAADAVSSPPQRPEVSGHPGQMLLNGVYLVETDHEETFFDVVDDLRARHEDDGLELLQTGPWPAYNFVPGAIGAAW